MRGDGGVSERTRYGVWEMDARRSTDRMCRSHTVRTIRARFIPGISGRWSGAAALVGTSVRVGERQYVYSPYVPLPDAAGLLEPGRKARELRHTHLSDVQNAQRIFPSDFKAILANRIFFNSFIEQRHGSLTVFSGSSFTPWSGGGEGRWSAATTLPRLPP